MTPRPDYWPASESIADYDTTRDMAREFVDRALDAGEAKADIPNLVFAFVPSFGPEMGRDVVNEQRGIESAGMEGFM